MLLSDAIISRNSLMGEAHFAVQVSAPCAEPLWSSEWCVGHGEHLPGAMPGVTCAFLESISLDPLENSVMYPSASVQLNFVINLTLSLNHGHFCKELYCTWMLQLFLFFQCWAAFWGMYSGVFLGAYHVVLKISANVLIVCEKEERKCFITSTTSSASFSQLFGVSTLWGEKLKKGEKVEKTFCDFCLLHFVLFSNAGSDSHNLSSYSLQSFVCFLLKCFLKSSFWSSEK